MKWAGDFVGLLSCYYMVDREILAENSSLGVLAQAWFVWCQVSVFDSGYCLIFWVCSIFVCFRVCMLGWLLIGVWSYVNGFWDGSVVWGWILRVYIWLWVMCVLVFLVLIRASAVLTHNRIQLWVMGMMV